MVWGVSSSPGLQDGFVHFKTVRKPEMSDEIKDNQTEATMEWISECSGFSPMRVKAKLNAFTMSTEECV